MLEQVIAKRDTDQECGVIGAYVNSFAAYLAACGYAPATIQSPLKLLGQFNEWLIRRRGAIHQLNDELVTTFLKRGTRRGSSVSQPSPDTACVVAIGPGG